MSTSGSEAIRKIDKQIELENAASSVYTLLRKNTSDPELEELWKTLAIHETYHAAALERLKATLTLEELAREASTLDEKNIDRLLEQNRSFMEEIPNGINSRRAFEIAISMEFSELNSLFFNSLDKKNSSTYIESMGEGTRSHLLSLYKGLKRFAGEDESLPYIDKFREFGLTEDVSL